MEEAFLTWLSSDNGFVIHVTVFTLLILGGLGFPIPEDIPILLGGVAAAKDIVYLHSIFITCYTGVMLADQSIYFVGYYFGQAILSRGTKSAFLPSITEEKVAEIRSGLRRRRLFYIFAGRHLFPVRSVTFLTAGALRIPYLEFLIADAIAALVSITIILGIGYYLGENLTPEIVQHLVSDAHYYIGGAVLIVLLIFLLRRSIKRRARERQAQAVTKQEQLPEQESAVR